MKKNWIWKAFAIVVGVIVIFAFGSQAISNIKGLTNKDSESTTTSTACVQMIED